MRRRPTRRSGRPQAGGARRRGALTLGRIAGAPVLLRPSWFLVAAALVLLFGPQVARIFPELGALAYAVALGYAAALLLDGDSQLMREGLDVPRRVLARFDERATHYEVRATRDAPAAPQ